MKPHHPEDGQRSYHMLRKWRLESWFKNLHVHMIDPTTAIYAVFGESGDPAERVYMDYSDVRHAFNSSTIDM